MLRQIKKQITQQLKKALGEDFSEEQIEDLIEIPAKPERGDFAFPCFRLAEQHYAGPKVSRAEFISKGEFKKAKEVLGAKIKDLAKQYSTTVSSKVAPEGDVSEIKIEGGYVNFFVDRSKLTSYVLNDVQLKGRDYGRSELGQGKLVVIDYSAPNWGKPMHVGHIRSTILGDSLIKVLNFAGYRTHGINYFGDIGLHMGKLIAAYQLWGDPVTIEASSEKAMLDLYVRYTKLEEEEKEKYGINKWAAEQKAKTDMGPLDEEEEGLESDRPVAPATKRAQEVLEKIEAGDPELVKIWQKIGEWSQIAFDRVYGLLNVKFDELTGQSRFTKLGKEQVWRAVRFDVAETTTSGAVEAKLEDYKLPNKIILKQDGTALYSTQDLGAAVHRFERFKFDKMVYIVAYEQDTYFKQIFKILERLGNDWAKNCHHFSFGLINLEEGKMSSREGNVVFLEEVLSRAINLAKEEIEKRNPSLPNKEETAKMIGIGAMKYLILSVDPIKDIAFSWKRALNFESNSAPYIQYAYARANSILRKAGNFPKTLDNYVLESSPERDLIRQIAQFPIVAENVAKPPYKLNDLANYADGLATSFNQFYKDMPVLAAENEQVRYSRTILVDAFKTTLENTLNLMGIQAPEQM